jgi:endonuclease IV
MRKIGRTVTFNESKITMDKLTEVLKEFSDSIGERFQKLENHLNTTVEECANLRERIFDLERGTPGFKDPSDFNRPDEDEGQ